jgi:hypothetical protein
MVGAGAGGALLPGLRHVAEPGSGPQLGWGRAGRLLD